MPRYPDDDEDDDWDDEADDALDEDDELPDGVYHEDDDDGEPTVPCPYCKHEILETAQYCPRCENYISREDAPRQSKSWFWIGMMLLALFAALVWLIGG
jgi:hypothetical protein